MISQFHFKNFDADEETRSNANLILNKILELAPYGATAVALIEKNSDGSYCCSLDIYSRQGPFMASTIRTTASEAIQAVEKKLRRQIELWHSHRETPRPTSLFERTNIRLAVS